MDEVNEEELRARINNLREKSMRDLSNISSAGGSLDNCRESAREGLFNSYYTTLREMMSTIKLYNQHFENNHMKAVEQYLSVLFKRVEEAL